MNHQGVLAPKDSKPDHQRYPLCRPQTSAPKMPNHPHFFPCFFPPGSSTQSWMRLVAWLLPLTCRYIPKRFGHILHKDGELPSINHKEFHQCFFPAPFFRLNFQPDSDTSQILSLKFWEMLHWNLPTSEPQDLLGVWRYGLIVCVFQLWKSTEPKQGLSYHHFNFCVQDLFRIVDTSNLRLLVSSCCNIFSKNQHLHLKIISRTPLQENPRENNLSNISANSQHQPPIGFSANAPTGHRDHRSCKPPTQVWAPRTATSTNPSTWNHWGPKRKEAAGLLEHGQNPATMKADTMFNADSMPTEGVKRTSSRCKNLKCKASTCLSTKL